MRHLRLDLVLTLALAIVTEAPVAQAKTFDVPCDVGALGDAMAAASFNDQEDVLWLAPSCAYAFTGILIAYADNGFPLTIQGRGATVSGQNQRTAFLVNPGATLYLENVTVTEGRAGPTASGDGGAIYNAGALTLTRSTVSASEARLGGGIFNAPDARLTLVQSSVSNNTAGEDGGGILNRHGKLTVIASAISGNRANGQDGKGAAIFNDSKGPGSWAQATVTNCTVSGNASRFGAGIFNDEGAMTVSNSTVSGNTIVGGGNGGGMYNRSYSGFGLFKLGNSIVANSLAEFGGFDCARDPHIPANPIWPTASNIVEDGSCGIVAAISGDPMLGSPTGNPAHHPLHPGSPAIDAGGSFQCAGVDQRGALRPLDGNQDGTNACDLGSYEAP